MPYINQDDRERAKTKPVTAGELNYAITMMIQDYIKQSGGVSYRIMNEVTGVLECCKLELYRKITSKYEDIKIYENGDVFTLDITN
ncbi:hypothetical protein [uncultured Arcobacter sp.]|uniref:DUF6899 family protein n=1 Tax=uncultured Arcobacter sp. TaxID=165434 RepID=UPI002617FDA2|nr:hypothetical protein [uncultured Arcobacter sp.]